MIINVNNDINQQLLPQKVEMSDSKSNTAS